MDYNFKHLNEGKWQEFSLKTRETRIKIQNLQKELEISNIESNKELLLEIEEVMVDVEDYVEDFEFIEDFEDHEKTLCTYTLNIPADRYEAIFDLIEKLNEHIGEIGDIYYIYIRNKYVDIDHDDIIEYYKDSKSELRIHAKFTLDKGYKNGNLNVSIRFDRIR